MGTIGPTGDRGFIFLDFLFALFVLLIGFSGVFAAAVSLQRGVSRYRDGVYELIDEENDAGTGWFTFEAE